MRVILATETKNFLREKPKDGKLKQTSESEIKQQHKTSLEIQSKVLKEKLKTILTDKQATWTLRANRHMKFNKFIENKN